MLFRILTITGLLFGFSLNTAIADDAVGKRDGVYQIVKATDKRVWRLNTETGEIAVCDLSGENLVCTTSTNAAQVPQKSYEQIEAERAQAAEEAKLARKAERERELQFLDKILALFRELLQTALGKDSGS